MIELPKRRARVLAVSERLYRALLVCAPVDFRVEHGEDATRLFRDKMRAALRHRSWLWAVLTLARALIDLTIVGVRERLAAAPAGVVPGRTPPHRSNMPPGRRRPAPRKERFMDSLSQDLRFSARMLRKQPALSALVVVTLALGIGANTTVFSFVKALFLDPLAVGDLGRIVAVHGTVEEGLTPGASYFPVSWPNYEDLRAQNGTLAGLAASGFAQAGLSDGAGEPVFEPAQLVSANYFDVLGVTPVAGRTFRPEEEDPPGAHAVAVISYSLWQERYGGEAGTVGRTIRLNGHPFTIVGIAPPDFGGTNVLFENRIWVPISMHPQLHSYSEFVDARRWRMFQLFGRLREGVTAEQAEADLRTIAQRLAEEYPEDNHGRLAQVTPLAEAAIDPNRRDLFLRSSALLLAVAGVVLLIACANVANLMLARARLRHREIAMRLSLGAGRGRLVRQLACEGLLLAALGGAASLLVVVFGRDLLWAFRPPFLAETLDIGLDLRVLGVTAVLALTTGLGFAVAPALRATDIDAAAALKESGQTRRRDGVRRRSLRSALVVVQVALSFVAVIGAGLFLSSLQQAQRIDPGFDVERLLLAPLNPAAQGYTTEQTLQFYERLEAEVAALPQIDAAGFASNPPLTPTFLSRTTLREGDPEDQAILIGTNAVTPVFFETMGIPLLRGRTFDGRDRAGSRPVIVVNDVMAERLWPGEEPIGKRVRFAGEQEHFEVIGVVGAIKYNTLGEEAQPYFYQPVRQRPAASGVLHVRTPLPPTSVADQVRAAIREIDPELPLADFDTATANIDASLWAPRMAASLLSVFGSLSLTLALIGIYGVLAQLVGERTREIGIRMALGADRGAVVSMVAVQTMRWVLVGGLLGVGVALAASRWLGSFLYEIRPTDPITYAATAGLLVLAALLAAGLPARRAVRVDPALAMRQD